MQPDPSFAPLGMQDRDESDDEFENEDDEEEEEEDEEEEEGGEDGEGETWKVRRQNPALNAAERLTSG